MLRFGVGEFAVGNKYPKLNLMVEQNRRAIKNIRTEFLKMRVLEQQAREREGVHEETLPGTKRPEPVQVPD